jgi:hypothetical protein
MSKMMKEWLYCVGSSLDVFGAGPRLRRAARITTAEAFALDSQSLGKDWQKVGDDLRAATLAVIHGQAQESTGKASR